MTKPTVQIKDAYITEIGYWSDSNLGILSGIPLDYPDEHQYRLGALENGKRVWTSAIVKQEGNVVETRRTIYHVLNWIDQPDPFRNRE